MIDQFLANQQLRGLAAKSVRRRAWTLFTFARQLEPRTLIDAQLADVEVFLAQRPCVTTRAALLSDLRQFYQWAQRRDLADTDPTAKIDRFRIPTRDATPLTVEQLRAALSTTDARLRRMVSLGAFAGLRVGEIAALCADDVHHARGLLVVRNGKGGRDRIVPLAPALGAQLSELQPGPVIVSRRRPGRCLTADWVSEQIRRHLRELGIDRRPHDLRHTFGTEAARRSGGNMMLVANLMGHKSVTTTQRYIRWNPVGRDVIDDLYGGEAA